MRVAIAGAGNVGRSIAAELLENNHQVLLVDKDSGAIKADSVPEAETVAVRLPRSTFARRYSGAALALP